MFGDVEMVRRLYSEVAGVGDWSVEDGPRWWRLGPSVGPSAGLALLWLMVQLVARNGPLPGPGGWPHTQVSPECVLDDACVVVPVWAFGGWLVLSVASVSLIRDWPMGAVACSVGFAAAELWFVSRYASPGLALTVGVVGYAAACAAHAWYRVRAQRRQMRFAELRGQPCQPIVAVSARDEGVDEPEYTRDIVAGAVVTLVWGAYSLLTWQTDSIPFWIQVPVAAAVVAGIGIGWRYHEKATALEGLKVGAHLGIPVDATLDADYGVWLCPRGSDQPFAMFFASLEGVPVGEVVSGNLYGQLRPGGYAAFASQNTLILPETGLQEPGPSSPTAVRDLPSPDALAVSRSRRERYEIRPDAIVRTELGRRQVLKVETMPWDTLTKVEWSRGEEGEGYSIAESLSVQSADLTFTDIPHDDDFRLVLGARLIQADRTDAVTDDRTRLRLGLIGGRRPGAHVIPTDTGPLTPKPNMANESETPNPQAVDRPHLSDDTT